MAVVLLLLPLSPVQGPGGGGCNYRMPIAATENKDACMVVASIKPERWRTNYTDDGQVARTKPERRPLKPVMPNLA